MDIPGNIKRMGNNLRNLRRKIGWSQQAAADAMHISRGQYIKLERGERRLTSNYIASAAKAFNVGQAMVLDAPATVPIVGYVGAGSVAHYYGEAADPHEADEAPMPQNGTVDTVAVEVRGDSLGSLFNRWLVYYNEVRTPPTQDMLRKLCVVGLSDGQVLVKQLLVGTMPGRFHLLSQTEGIIENARIDWAARVIAITPR